MWLQSWVAAVRRREFGGILQNHSSDIVMFDVPPPFQSKGLEAYKKTWDLFFSWSSDPVPFDITEMSITAGGMWRLLPRRCVARTWNQR
jgi:ketosteroid isomerase-like protein